MKILKKLSQNLYVKVFVNVLLSFAILRFLWWIGYKGFIGIIIGFIFMAYIDRTDNMIVKTIIFMIEDYFKNEKTN